MGLRQVGRRRNRQAPLRRRRRGAVASSPSFTPPPASGGVTSVVLANPAWPVVGVEVDFTQGPPNVPGPNRSSINRPDRKMGVRQLQIDRGRQYELDQAQAGQATIQVLDPLELLNPDNAASPYNAGANDVTPYRCCWVWAMWPNQPASGNIINTGVSGTYDPTFETSTGGWSKTGATTLAQSSAQAWQGTKSLLVTQAGQGPGWGASNWFPTVPGLTYTASVYVFPTAGCSVTLQVVDDAGTVWTSTTAATPSTWTRLSVTWNSVDTLEVVTVYGTGVAAPTFYMDGTALNFGSTAQTFSSTGPTLNPLFTGYVERYPATYDMAGTRATRPLVAVDALAILSRTAIAQSYDRTVIADSPTLYFPYDNSAAPNLYSVGGIGLAGQGNAGSQALVSPNGFVPYQATQHGQVQWGGDQFPDGTPALVLQQSNSLNPPGRGHTGTGYPDDQQTVQDVYGRTMWLSNIGSTIEIWARFSSGIALIGQLLQAKTPPSLTTELGYGASNTQNHLEIYGGSGQLAVNVCDSAAGFSSLFSLPAGPNYPDGQWHYYSIIFYLNGANPGLALRKDGTELIYSAPSGVRVYGYTNLHHEAITDFGDAQSQISIGRWAMYNRDIGSATRQAHYQRGVGFVGELSGARVARLLGTYWAGATVVATGKASLAPDFDYDTRTVLDVMQEIQDTERGLVYASRTGQVVFEDRSTRYATQSSLWTLGENTAGGEFPYSDFAADHDPTYVYSQVNLTRPGNSNYVPQVNTTTQTRYGQRVLTQDVKVTTDFDLGQAASFYLTRYATPKTRISKLTLDPASNPALWPVVLALGLSQRITVTRRTAVTTSGDYYTENVSHRVDAASGQWTTDLQASPVFVPTAWKLGDATYGVLGSTTVPVY